MTTFESISEEQRAFAEIVLARVLAETSDETERVRTLVDTARERMNGLFLKAESRLLREIGEELGWTQLVEEYTPDHSD